MTGFFRAVLRIGLGLFVLAVLGRVAQTLSTSIGVTPSATFVTLGVIAAVLGVGWLWLGGK